jgi:hypothetical protein
MNVFAVIALSDSSIEPIRTAVAAQFPENYLEAGRLLWLIADSGTAQSVSNQLGIATGTLGSVVVIAFSGYYGRAPVNIWEWIKSKAEAPPK